MILGDEKLTAAALVRAARTREQIGFSRAALDRMRAGEARLRERVASRTPIYGLTTGVGALDGEEAPLGENRFQQASLLRSHAAAVGPPMPEEAVRGMMIARLASLVRGVSGVRPEAALAIAELLNRGIVPLVPEAGSIGCSDLAPLAHAGLVAMGEGSAIYDGSTMDAAEALHRAALTPLVFELRDAFAWINGLAQSAAFAAFAAVEAEMLHAASEIAVALTMSALGSQKDFLDPRLAALKNQAGLGEAAARLRALGGDSDDAGFEAGAHPLREALSTRCAAHASAAVLESIAYAEAVATRELASAVDNPVIGDGFSTNTCGNPDGTAIALAMDSLTASLTAVAAMSERRSARLLNPAHNGGLPGFLVDPRARPGTSSGLMIAQYAAAARVGEMRATAAPVSGMTLPVSANSEDWSSMSAFAARRARAFVSMATEVVAIELLVASRGVELRGLPLPPALAPYQRVLRDVSDGGAADRIVTRDIASVMALVSSGALRSHVP